MAQQTASASAFGRNVAGFFRSGSRLSRAGWRALRGGGAIALAALAVFHVSLFWDRLLDGQLLDPLVAARWLGAAALTAGLVALRRRGVSLIAGRRALVVWLLVVLLHFSAKPAIVGADAGPASASDLIFVVPSTAGVTLVGVGLLIATFAASRVRPTLACLCTVEPGETRRVAAGWRPAGTARAPPLQLV